MDLHLCEPHSTRRFRCNFCNEFKTERKEEYRIHLQSVHGREAKFESKFLGYDFMCNICDFECFSSSSYEYMKKHMQTNCPFREENLKRSAFLAAQTHIDPSCFINYSHILNNLLSPEYFDLLVYEFSFGVKPIDSPVNKYALFTQALNTSSPLNLQIRRVEADRVMQTKIYQMLISNTSPDSNSHIPISVQNREMTLSTGSNSSSSHSFKSQPVVVNKNDEIKTYQNHENPKILVNFWEVSRFLNFSSMQLPFFSSH